MATPTQPATSAVFRALRSVDVDPDLAYEAAEEIRHEAGQNVIAVVEAQIAGLRAEVTEFRAELKAENAEIRSEVKAQGARIDAVGSQIEALGSRIDTLQKVIWPLIGLLATTVFGLLYKAVIG